MASRELREAAVGTSTIEFMGGLGPPALFLLVTTGIIVAVPLGIYPHLDSQFVFFAVLSATFALIAAVAWAALRWEGVTARDVGLCPANVLPGVLPVVGLYVLLNAIGAGILLVAGESIGLELSDRYDSVAMWAVGGIAYLVFNGMAEEFAFRAYLQNKVIALLDASDDRIRKAGAILVGALVFTLAHVSQRVLIMGLTAPTAILQTLVVILVLGVVLGVLYEYTRNVVFVGVLHGTFNWHTFVVAGMPVVEVTLVVGLPVLLLVVWYYRRWATGANAPEFAQQRQRRAIR